LKLLSGGGQGQVTRGLTPVEILGICRVNVAAVPAHQCTQMKFHEVV
jgi:hypothetical protein